MLVELAHVAIIAACLAVAVFYGRYMARVFNGDSNLLTPIIRPMEKIVYRLCGIDEQREMSWKNYLLMLICFEVLGIAFFFVLLMLQGFLPLNPQGLGSFRWDTALNTAFSFVTNTEWQVYSGERDMSYLSQILGVIVQDFLSPAVGLACSVALIRGFVRKNFNTIGNFWVDVTRIVFYIILPLALILAFVIASQGVIQNMNPYVTAKTLEGAEQLIPGGPAAGLIAMQIVCEDGGGFFNVNAVHPFETPTPLSYAFEMGIMLLVPASMCFAFGEMIRNRKIGWALFGAMLALYLLSSPFYLGPEFQGNPILEKLGVAGGMNMEGKEMRFTLFEDMIWTLTSMCPANGSTLVQHDSVLPLSFMGILWNIVVGAPIFGCWGEGIITMLYYFILAMFLGGLMTGRSPEMAGKKIEPREIILAAVSLLSSSLPTLVFTGIAISLPLALAGLNNYGPHGLMEIFYNYASICVNNGSPAAGLTTNTPFYNLTIVVGMAIGRYSTMFTALAIAGSLAKKKIIPMTAATLPVTSPFFIILVVGTVIIVNALQFFPIMMLGPILEHLFMQLGRTF
jgi:K+-transporting ATPase ATPase A chain